VAAKVRDLESCRGCDTPTEEAAWAKAISQFVQAKQVATNSSCCALRGLLSRDAIADQEPLTMTA
jgi:hypothetical protein